MTSLLPTSPSPVSLSLFLFSVIILTTASSTCSFVAEIIFFDSFPLTVWKTVFSSLSETPIILSSKRSSSSVKISHALRNGRGVFASPIPITRFPLSRSLLASLVKSLSLETRQNPSSSLAYSISIASMIIAESVAFFP